MRKKIFKIVLNVSMISTGIIIGNYLQKRNHKRKTLYVGTLQVLMNKDAPPELFLELNETPETILTLSNVILDVKRFDISGLA